jgi:hypothetical protein
MIPGMSTVMLGQQELMTPPRRRKLAVVAGHEAWWGVDPSTQRIALAGVDGRGVWSRELPFAPLRDGVERLNAIYEATRKMIVGVATCVPWPGVVWVEQASGSSRNLPLEYAVGVIQAAVFAGLLDVCGRAVRVEAVASASWKKIACGHGDIYKPKRGDAREYEVLSWARANGYEGRSWDQADARGIAVAASREIELQVW